MRLDIYVPTRGRINVQQSMKFLRLQKIAEKGKDRVTFAVPCCEVVAFRKVYPWARVVAMDDSWKIGDISENLITRAGGRYRVLVDDDFQLLRRRDPNSVSQKGGVATDKDAFALFDRVWFWLKKGYVHGGISLRQTNHFCTGTWFKENSRVSGFMFFDTAIVSQENVHFNTVQERQDFHITLSLLELGYPNVVDFEFTVGQYLIGTNAPGGCSRYRNPKFLLDQAKLLCKVHPNSCKLIFKQPKVAKETKAMVGEEGIPDVRISWARSLGINSKMRRAKNLKGVKVCTT